MTVNQAFAELRCVMKRERHAATSGDGISQYHMGVAHGIGRAVRLIDVAVTASGCPECGAGLPGDGSCCDACGWVRED